MPFPTTPILDDFNTGATQNLTARAGWSSSVYLTSEATMATDSVPTYASGTAFGGWRSNYWNTSFTDAEVWIVTGPLQHGGSLCIWTRGAPGATVSGYCLTFNNSFGNWNLAKVVSGSFTTLASGTQPLNFPSDAIGLSSISATHIVYFKGSAGSWSQLATVTESTFASGNIAIEALDGDTIDSFGGGAPSIYTTMAWPMQSYADASRGVKFG